MVRVIDHFREHQQISSAMIAEDNRRKWFIAARDQRDRKAEIEERAEDDFIDLVSSVILATEIEVQEFQAKLDTYDEATVKALMENQEAMDLVQTQIDDMLSDTHVLEDGTRVFKSEDGTWAVDENGDRLNPQTQDIDQIPQTKHTAEEYLGAKGEHKQLIQERQSILDYQEKLDDARERSNAEDFSKEELDTLDKELEAEMPMAVKRQLPNYDPSQETNLKSDFVGTVQPAINTASDIAINSSMMPSMR